MNKKYVRIKNKFIIGLIAYIIGIGCAIGLHFVWKDVDWVNFDYYVVGDAVLFGGIGLGLGAIILLGLPFLRLDFILAIFKRLLMILKHQKDTVNFAAKSDYDYIEVPKDANGKTEVKGKIELIIETVLAMICFIVLTIVFYAIGVVLSIFVLIGQLIYLLIAKGKKQDEGTR